MEIKNLPSLKQFKEIAKTYRRLNPEITSHSASLDLLTKEMKFAKNWNVLRPQLLPDNEIDTTELEKLYADAKLDLKNAMIKTYFLQKNEVLGFVIMAFSGHNEWGQHFVAEYCFEAVKHRKPLHKHIQNFGGMALLYEDALKSKKEAQSSQVLQIWQDEITIKGFIAKVKKLHTAEAKQTAMNEISIGDIYEFEPRHDKDGNYCEDVCFYEVVKKTGSFVHFREIAAEIIPVEDVPKEKRSLGRVHRMQNDGDDVYKRPLPGQFINDNVFRHKIKHYGDSLQEVNYDQSFSYMTHRVNGYESFMFKIGKEDIWYRDKHDDKLHRARMSFNEKVKCEECGDAKVKVEYMLDPYQSSIEGTSIKRWLCEECLYDQALVARAGNT